jgi:hypothetical protein
MQLSIQITDVNLNYILMVVNKFSEKTDIDVGA